MHKSNLHEAFLEMANFLLENVKTEHWFVEAGTLLGLHRDRRLIAWDKDVDFGILAEHFTPAITEKILQKTSFKFYKSYGTPRFGYELRFIHPNGTKVDLFLFYKERWNNKAVRYCTAYDPEMFAMPFDAKLIENRAVVDYVYIEGKKQKMLTLPAPFPIPLYLQARYGDWKKPDPKYDWRYPHCRNNDFTAYLIRKYAI